MKKTKKIITILMLISMISSFISPLCVNALTSGDVYNYITNTKTTYNNLKTKLEVSKNETKYTDDETFKFAIDLIEKNVENDNNTLNENELLLDNKVSLKNLIENYFPEKLEEYSLNFQDDILLDVNTLENIEYTKDENNYTLLTKEEISNVLIENYFKELNDNIVSYNNFYNDKVSLYLTTYNKLVDEIENAKIEINDLIHKVNEYKNSELLLNNNPNMDLDNKDVISLLEEKISTLENTFVTLDNYKTLKNDIDDIKNEAISIYNKFELNNRNYIDLGLDVKINELNDKYNITDSSIDKTNYYNLDNISSLIDVVTNEYNLELLNISINTYLERRPSDTLVINNLLSNINEKRVTLNKEVAINYLEGMVNNTDLTNEDNVDKLYKLTYLNFIKEETKEKIYNAKLSFYSFDLKDKTNYDYEIYKEYFIINTLTKIDENELINNISYDYRYLVKYSNEKLELTLFDKNDNLIRTYEIIIKGDLNNDKNLDYTDIELFRDKLLKNEEIKEIDLIKLDFNKDNEVTFDDLVLARDKVNNIIQIGDTTEASYVITKTKEDNKVYYTVTLKTDGKVTGLVFDLNTSSNLSFDSITYLNDKLNIDDITKPTKLIGLDDFTNDERLITICYTDTKDMEEDIIFNIIESITYLDSKEKITINEISSVIPKKIVNDNIPKQEETKVIYVDNNVNNDDNSSDEPSKDNKPTNDNKNDNNKDVKEDNENLLPNIIKIVVIVLLGTLIVYFMNKNEKEEEINFDDKKEEK